MEGRENFLVDSVKTHGFEMEYIKFGSGMRPLVVIPGMSLKSVIPLAPLVSESYKIFSKDYSVYLFDRRKEFPENYSVEQMAADTADAMKNLNIRCADVVGISQGGMIAQLIAENDPSMVHRLVLASSASRANEISTRSFERWSALAESKDVDGLCSDFIDKVFSEETVAKYKESLMYVNRDASERDMERFGMMARANIKLNCYENLSKIKCRTLVLGARLDKVLGVESSIEIAEKLKESGIPCELYIYENYGHAAYDEAPDYRQRILDFLKG